MKELKLIFKNEFKEVINNKSYWKKWVEKFL